MDLIAGRVQFPSPMESMVTILFENGAKEVVFIAPPMVVLTGRKSLKGYLQA